MIRTNLHLAEKQLAALRDLSRESGLTVAEIVRRAVDAYIKDTERSG